MRKMNGNGISRDVVFSAVRRQWLVGYLSADHYFLVFGDYLIKFPSAICTFLLTIIAVPLAA